MSTDETPSKTAGRGIRQRNPPTQFTYRELGNPVIVPGQGSLRPQPAVSCEVRDESAPTVVSRTSSAAIRLRENELDADRKVARLEQEIEDKAAEISIIEVNLESFQKKLALYKESTDEESKKEILPMTMHIIDLETEVSMKRSELKHLKAAAERKIRLIRGECDLNKEIIIEEEEGDGENEKSLTSSQKDAARKRTEDWSEDAAVWNNRGDVSPPIDAVEGNNMDKGDSLSVSALVNALGQAFGRQQMVTKYVEKDLPSFTGKAEDWLTFKSEFDRTTKKYNYDDSENIVRLGKYVKGAAKDSIHHLLANPGNVQKIMTVLEQRFGNPKFVLAALIEKAKVVRSPDVNKPETIVDFGTAVDALVTNVVAFKMDDYLNNIQLLNELADKLPGSLRRDWYRWLHVYGKKENLESFQSWLENEVDLAVRSMKPRVYEDEREKSTKTRRSHGMNAASDENNMCTCCNKPGHEITECFSFKKKKIDERWNIAKSNRLCFLCLQPGHNLTNCDDCNHCGVDSCTGSHHRLLHRKSRDKSPSRDKEGGEQQTDQQAGATESGHAARQGSLPMMYVRVNGPLGSTKVLALLDLGCSFTAIQKDVADKIGLRGKAEPLTYTVMGNQMRTEEDSEIVTCKVSGTGRSATQYDLSNVKTVRDLGIAASPLDFASLKRKYPHLKSARATSIGNEKPQMVLGFNNYRLYSSKFVLEGDSANSPAAYRCRLGWYVFGGESKLACYMARSRLEDASMHEDMKNFFSIENAGVKKDTPIRSKEDKRALQLLEKHTKQVGNRWETCLLWRDENCVLPESKQMALTRLYTMERKMHKDPEFARLCQSKFDDYIEKGYLVPADSVKVDQQSPFRKWYLPWFFSYHPTKKPRLVYDAAAKSNGKCLNDFLLKGPDLLNPLPSILLKFRMKPVALTGDIKEMFHQVKLRVEDWPSQTILYRGLEKDGPVQEYFMTVLFFGAASSPCSAIYVKDRNADLFKIAYPEAVKMIKENFYMDDLLGSTETEAEAILMSKQITEINEAGGFSVVKWNSNSNRVISSIPTDRRAGTVKLSAKGELAIDKTLGMWWNPQSDEFVLRFNNSKIPEAVTSGSRRPTKREVTSAVMSMFDPLGYLAPLKVEAMMMIQNIWRSGIDWDDEITSLLNDQWKTWLSYLNDMKEITMKRTLTLETYNQVELHVFADASEDAYCSSAYLRFVSDKSTSYCFVAGKARVGPLKKQSVPRMELEAAVLGVRLATLVKSALSSMALTRTVFWSDSKTVLCWVRSECGRFKMFVQTRLGEVWEQSNVQDWRYVPSKLNPADDATRQKIDFKITSSCRWLSGPEFLAQRSEKWPNEVIDKSLLDSEQLEARETCYVAQEKQIQDWLPLVERFSCWFRLVRATAAVIAAIKGFRKQSSKIEVGDLERAEILLVKRSQLESFPAEVAAMKAGQPISKNSRLKNLSVGINTDGLLVIRGRIDSAGGVDKSTKQPFILDPRNEYTKLWIHWIHKKGGHHGQERAICETRLKAWILDCRAAVRRCWATCKTCQLRKFQPKIPEMGQIPACRLIDGKGVFHHTGVDLFGPMQVKVGRSYLKRWGVLFTCMSSRAVHIDIVESLTTDEIINCLVRFVAIRGPVQHLWSDNGTNFVGADRELRKCIRDWNNDAICSTLSAKGIDWHFNPPASPHMGGSWESLIGVAKKIMKEIMKSRAPRESILRTVLCEVADIMNSRPLTIASNDPEDWGCITPNHLLKMAILDGPALPGTFEEKDKFSRAWKYAQYLANDFWRRWNREYVPTLLKRRKWFVPAKPLELGDVVLVINDLVPRSNWKKGIVVAVHPGKDGQVRVVDVRTTLGKSLENGKQIPTPTIIRRPATKVIPLDLLATVTGHWEGEMVQRHQEERGE